MEGEPSVVVVLRRAQKPLFKQPDEDTKDEESSSSSPPTEEEEEEAALKPVAVEEDKDEDEEDDVSLGEVSRMGFDADSRGFAAEPAAATAEEFGDDDTPSAVVLMKDGGNPLASASAVAAESVVVAAPLLAQLLSPIARTAAVAASASDVAAGDDSRCHPQQQQNPQEDEEAEQQSSIRGGCCFGGSFVAVDGEDDDDVDMCMQDDVASSGTARPQSPWPPPPLSPFSAASASMMMDVDEDNSHGGGGGGDADGAAPEICEPQQQLQQSGFLHHGRTVTIVDAVRAQLGQRALSAAAVVAKGAGAGATASREAEVALEGRESEMEQLRVHLGACAFAGIPGCMFVTGAAGTGKTSAVRAVVADFHRARDEEHEQEQDQAKEKWAVAWVNCVRFAQGTPADIFASLCRSLGVEEAGSRGSGRMGRGRGRGGGGDAGVLERALERRVCEGGPAVVVVDEADSLFARGRRRALFAALSWPLLAGSRAVVIAISNAARPPATFWKKLQSRMGIWRVHFGPYGADALERIATARVASAGVDADADSSECGSAVLGADAIHTLAVRLAVTCGDARRMLGLCNAAIDAALDRRRRRRRRRIRHDHHHHRHRINNSESGKEEEDEDEEAPQGFTREHPLVEMQDVDAAVAELLLADPLAAGISALSAPLGVLLATVVRRAMLLGGGSTAGGAWVSAADALEDAQRVWSSSGSSSGGGKHSPAAGMAGAPRCWRDAVCALGELEAMGLVRVVAVASPSSGAMAGAGEFCGGWEDMPQFSATAAPTRVVLRAGLGHTARLWRVQAAVDRETLLASLSSPAHGDLPSASASASASAAREILLRT